MRNQAMVQEINNAIGAHGMWKMRQRTAINAGHADVSAAAACCDDKCAFGKWLYGPSIDANTRADKPYQVVKRLHAEFHQSAGGVLGHVERGNRTAAQNALEADYSQRSEKLVRALTKWKGELLQGSSLGAINSRASRAA